MREAVSAAPTGEQVLGVALWNGATWQLTGSGSPGGAIHFIEPWNGELYVGGGFNWMNGHASFGMARWGRPRQRRRSGRERQADAVVAHGRTGIPPPRRLVSPSRCPRPATCGSRSTIWVAGAWPRCGRSDRRRSPARALEREERSRRGLAIRRLLRATRDRARDENGEAGAEPIDRSEAATALEVMTVGAPLPAPPSAPPSARRRRDRLTGARSHNDLANPDAQANRRGRSRSPPFELSLQSAPRVTSVFHRSLRRLPFPRPTSRKESLMSHPATLASGPRWAALLVLPAGAQTVSPIPSHCGPRRGRSPA